MICETCTHADNVYPGCIDCVIGADPFWDDEEECEDCTYYHEAETLKEYSRRENYLFDIGKAIAKGEINE